MWGWNILSIVKQNATAKAEAARAVPIAKNRDRSTQFRADRATVQWWLNVKAGHK